MDVPQIVQHVATGLGFYTIFRGALSTANFLRLNVAASPDLDRYKALEDPSESWAIVTGASEGIGRAFVDDLADYGFNVIMIALDDEVLEEAHRSLRMRKVPRKVCIEKIGFDFSQPLEAYTTTLFPKIREIVKYSSSSPMISILVNNVGINYPFPRPFETISSQREAMILRVNCESALHMTKFVLPEMKKANRGAIINMSSVTGTIPAGLLSTYAATKVFNAHFSKCMGAELEGLGKSGVHCLAVAPNFIATKMSRRKAGGLVNTPEELVDAALSQIGKTDFTAGGLRQNLIMSVYHSLPGPVLKKVVVGANAGVMDAGFKSEKAKMEKRKRQQEQQATKMSKL